MVGYTEKVRGNNWLLRLSAFLKYSRICSTDDIRKHPYNFLFNLNYNMFLAIMYFILRHLITR